MLVFAMFCLSCSKEKQHELPVLKKDKYPYSVLYLNFGWAKVSANAFTNVMTLETHGTRDSLANSGVVYHLPINKKSYEAKIAKWEKDSVYSWMKRLVVTPVRPNSYCTDYVGYARFTIISNQVTQSCTYDSVCDWKKLSPETEKLHKLISSKFSLF
ncbi:hypothetical protein [Hymenobacter lapidarius]|uniref:hypothetical protein n=1 Tax=Hymenobacter lapidarius TaxID=1908237 RepID=UPI00195A4B14|nr:hypothetical protein [Hymenobacter lapidarius]